MSKKISELSSATTPLSGSELVEIVQSGVSKSASVSSISSAGFRELLTGNRTYYVRTDGSDSNNGLANTSGGAFLTIQKAVDVVYQTIDTGAYNVTIQVADGTYSGAVVCSGPLTGSGNLTIQGNSAMPTNVVLSTGSSTCVTSQYGASVTLKDFKVTSTASGIYATKRGNITFSGLDFGSVTSHQVRTDDDGYMLCSGNYTISGGGSTHFRLVSGILRVQSKTVTISGTPAFSAYFSDIGYVGLAFVDAITFSGSATGARYRIELNGVCYTNAGGANYFPGNSAGSTATGGQYT